jgi:opacity protein-like surface antigen
MKPMKLTSSAVLLALVALSAGVAAQDQQPVSNITGNAPVGESRIEVGLAFAQTLASSTFSSSFKVREYQEDGTFDASYKVGKAPGAGFDLQYNLKPKFGVRLGMQTFSRKSNGTFTAQIPHPFFFSTPRRISGAESGLGFSESAVSVTGVFRGGSGKWRLSVEGGPAFFSVSATVADKITYGEVYPYDTATYSGVTSSKKRVSPVGFALGVEVGRQLSNAVTVVAQGRFAQGSGDLDVNGTKVNVKAGGAQARLGLRIVLARKKAVS